MNIKTTEFIEKFECTSAFHIIETKRSSLLHSQARLCLSKITAYNLCLYLCSTCQGTRTTPVSVSLV